MSRNDSSTVSETENSNEKDAEPPPGTVRIIIDSILGKHVTVVVNNDLAIRALKNGLHERGFCGTPQEQALLKRDPKAEHGYVQLSDYKTLDEYGIKSGDHLIIVPIAKAGPVNYLLNEPPQKGTVDVFLGVQDDEMKSMLKNNGCKKEPNKHYILARVGGQVGVLEITFKGETKQDQPASEGEQNEEPTPEEAEESDKKRLEENRKTRSVMSKVRRLLQKFKQKGKEKTDVEKAAESDQVGSGVSRMKQDGSAVNDEVKCECCHPGSCSVQFSSCLKCKSTFCKLHKDKSDLHQCKRQEQ